MTDEETRYSIVAEARKWIGTPYHNCADILHAGVDCGMLLVRVFCDLGLVKPFDPRPYSPDWHLHSDDERYLAIINRIMEETGGGEIKSPLPGDVMVFHWGRAYSHGAIISLIEPTLTVVHAFTPQKMVVEEPLRNNMALTDPRRKRNPRFFSIFKQQAA